MNLVTFALVSILLITQASNLVNSSTTDIVQNGDFESGILPWKVGIYDPYSKGYAGTFIQSSDAYSGSYSGLFTVTSFPQGGSGYITVLQTISTQVGETYVMQFYYKCSMTVYPSVFCYDSSWNSLGVFTGQTLSPTSTWTLVTINLGAIPSGTVRTQIHFDASSTGTFKVDYVVATDTATSQPPAINIMENGDFESGILPWKVGIYDPYSKGYAGTFIQSSDAYSGSYSGLFTVTSFPQGGSGYITVLQTISTQVGETYVMQFYYKCSMTVYPSVFCYDSSWNSLGVFTGQTLSPTSTWTLVTINLGAIPSGTVRTQIHFDASSTGTFKVDYVVATDTTANQTPASTPPPSTTQTGINKAAILYGASWSSSDINFAASHFTLTSIDFEASASTIQSLKSVNPNLKVLGYRGLIAMKDFDPYKYGDWAEVNFHEDWFLHDAHGNRLECASYPGVWLMDPSNSGWRAHLVSVINQKINAGGYDGVLLDEVYPQEDGNGPQVYYPGMTTADIATWKSDLIGFLHYIKANIISGKLVLINTPDWTSSDYVNQVDGRMFEGFAHAEWESASTNYNWRPLLTLRQINLALQNEASGKIVWMASGAIATGTSSDASEQKFCYTAFLLMAGPTAYFSYNSRLNSDGQKGYYTIMDTNIGSPIGAYYQIGNTGVYERDFTDGKVLCNLSGASRTITVNSKTITMAAFSGEILQS